MKSSFNGGKINESALYADSLLSLQGISAETINDALLIKANSLCVNKKPADALPIYKQLSSNKNGEVAAESRFHIAEIYFAQDSLQKAENAANETIRQSAGYDYWIVKSYILIADLFIKQNDYFNAKATLESIVKHTKITALKQESMDKLEEVKKLEKQKSKLKDE
jgi:tetratricopeptide (TPR) repeat protein